MTDLRRRYPIFSTLLKLYPPAYRRRYEQEMLQVTDDMLASTDSRLGRAAIWIQLALDVPIGILVEQLAFTTGPMNRETPRYVKLASVVSSLLLLPFVAALAANAADRIVFNRNLYHTWFWSHPAVWAVRLPKAALALAALSYFFYVLLGPSKNKSIIKRAIDIKLAWPILVPLVLGLGILFLVYFHDSAHCWLHNPLFIFNHINAEWRCTQVSG